MRRTRNNLPKGSEYTESGEAREEGKGGAGEGGGGKVGRRKGEAGEGRGGGGLEERGGRREG